MEFILNRTLSFDWLLFTSTFCSTPYFFYYLPVSIFLSSPFSVKWYPNPSKVLGNSGRWNVSLFRDFVVPSICIQGLKIWFLLLYLYVTRGSESSTINGFKLAFFGYTITTYLSFTLMGSEWSLCQFLRFESVRRRYLI